MRRPPLIHAALCAIALLATCVPGAAAADPALPDLLTAPRMESAGGLTVTDERDVSPSTFDVLVSTSEINPKATQAGLGIRIVLPTDYATSGKRYPVVYLLHGFAVGEDTGRSLSASAGARLRRSGGTSGRAARS